MTDDAYDRACPLCNAPVGEVCRTPSGKTTAAHATRRGKAAGSPTDLTPSQRSLRARIAATSRWANTTDEERRRQAERAQRGVLDGFRRQVAEKHPGITEPDLTRMAESLRKAKMLTMSLKASQARRKR